MSAYAITRLEAARLLGCSKTRVRQFEDAGILHSYIDADGIRRIDAEEVGALRVARGQARQPPYQPAPAPSATCWQLPAASWTPQYAWPGQFAESMPTAPTWSPAADTWPPSAWTAAPTYPAPAWVPVDEATAAWLHAQWREAATSSLLASIEHEMLAAGHGRYAAYKASVAAAVALDDLDDLALVQHGGAVAVDVARRVLAYLACR